MGDGEKAGGAEHTFVNEMKSWNLLFMLNQKQKPLCIGLSLIQVSSLQKGGFVMTSTDLKTGFYSI